jgi:hypothetical protein
MESLTVDRVMQLVEQLSPDERQELIRRLERLETPRRPSQSLRVFHVEDVTPSLTLRREDEYGDDER